jgi:hypothetical protein
MKTRRLTCKSSKSADPFSRRAIPLNEKKYKKCLRTNRSSICICGRVADNQLVVRITLLDVGQPPNVINLLILVLGVTGFRICAGSMSAQCRRLMDPSLQIAPPYNIFIHQTADSTIWKRKKRKIALHLSTLNCKVTIYLRNLMI